MYIMQDFFCILYVYEKQSLLYNSKGSNKINLYTKLKINII